jgi:hypothetical protein
MNDDKQTGDLNFDQQRDKGLLIFWGSEINTDRLDVFATKLVTSFMPYQSIGFQNAFNIHDQRSYFGLNQYNINK